MYDINPVSTKFQKKISVSRKMYKIVLKKDGRIVGDLGEFDSKREAIRVQQSFNIKLLYHECKHVHIVLIWQ